ncbi:Uma2 family endonuclease [Desulfosporosinus sp. PR]|uniref:Uma2 family endonuclease n=1 Tax=Candidatus Desulfosporosinus nitrosoreducens TaxID=3401928 RepID=UPI0027F6DFBC|nr:Uma2 family endonuclease [Desulfosporosinus sp. PR]MDQ7093583.1 Uma2 family endonuclease [Desulfosporosinus sp. PR]
MPIPESKGKYTYADYLTWPEGERWEIIDGSLYMQAVPTWQHQRISRELLRQISNYLIHKPGQVFAAPFDLCISEHDESDEEISNVISQPDLVVICDESKLRKTGYFGVPEIVIEITSPSTARADRFIKFNKYENAGVKEYWIVEPETKLVSVFVLLEKRRYGRPDIYTEDDKIKVSIFPDLVVDLKLVFEGI